MTIGRNDILAESAAREKSKRKGKMVEALLQANEVWKTAKNDVVDKRKINTNADPTALAIIATKLFDNM